MITIGVLAYIPSVRHRELLERTLASIASQDGAPSFQTILVDNGNAKSDDEKSAANGLEELARRYGVRYVRRESRDIASARELILREDSRYFGFVDSDVEVPTTWVAEMVAELDRDSKVAAVASSNRPPRGETAFEEALWALFQVPWNFLGSPQALQPLQTGGGYRDVDHLSSCAVLYRRDAVLRAGGYDPRFTAVGEDLELSRRLREQGKLRLLGSEPVTHRQDRDEWAWWNRMFRYGWGQIEVMRKHPAAILSLKGALLPIVPIAVLAMVRAVRGDTMMLTAMCGVYLLPVVGGIFVRNRTLPIATFARAATLTIGTHIAYVAGMIAGVAGIARNPPNSIRLGDE